MNKILFLKARTGMDDPSPPMSFSFLAGIAKRKNFEILMENLNAQYNDKKNEDIIELIKKEKPEIIGIHIFTNNSRDSYQLLKDIKPFANFIIAGGPHPTTKPEEVLELGVDVVFIGEAEISFEKFLDAFLKKKNLKTVEGIAFKEKDKIIKTKPAKIIADLDKIPLPDKTVHRIGDYARTKEEINNFGQILSTRGCPGRCTYCFSVFSKCYRFSSAKRVFEEIKDLQKRFGVTFINFIDDAFTINKQRLNDLCDLLINSKTNIEWSCSTRIDFLDEEIIKKMSLAGCRMITLGIESCVPKTLLNVKKTGNPEWYVNQSYNVLKWCYDSKIRAGVNILTGFPWENAEDMRLMQKYISKIKRRVTQGFYGGVLQPQPDTEIYKEYAKKYRFEDWWIKKKPLFKDDYRPFFMTYYHQYWDHLQNNFFDLDKQTFKEIDKLYRLMGRWNLYILTKRRFKNPIAVNSIYVGVFVLSKISEFLFYISPESEKKVMEKVKKFSYRFKFRKGTENSKL